jgi:hypothetical protein
MLKSFFFSGKKSNSRAKNKVGFAMAGETVGMGGMNAVGGSWRSDEMNMRIHGSQDLVTRGARERATS